MEVRDQAGRLMIRHRSFYRVASWTYTEGNHRLRRTPYKAFPSKPVPPVQGSEGNKHEVSGGVVDLGPPTSALKTPHPTLQLQFPKKWLQVGHEHDVSEFGKEVGPSQ